VHRQHNARVKWEPRILVILQFLQFEFLPSSWKGFFFHGSLPLVDVIFSKINKPWKKKPYQYEGENFQG
jgi:hypothetical protein